MTGLTYGCRVCGHSRFTYRQVDEYTITGDDLEERGTRGAVTLDGTGDKPREIIDGIYRCINCGFSRRDASKLVTKVRKR